MTDLNELSDLVRHSRLEAVFTGNDVTTHKLLRNRGGLRRHETWIKVKKIGHGGFGEVWLERKCEDTRDTSGQVETEFRAVKCVRASSQRRMYMRELEALATFSSNRTKYAEFFVNFYGWYESTEWLHAAMEYCELGDLQGYLGVLQERKRIPEKEVQEISRQILGGVSLMHEAGFAHRDIKPANILIKAAPPSAWWVKLGDLGLSQRAEAVGGSTTVRATPGFIPPELLGINGLSPKSTNPFLSDLWCVGETIFQALTGRETFDTYWELTRYVEGDIDFPHDALHQIQVSEKGIELIGSLMKSNPLHRSSAVQALRLPWLTTEDSTESLADHVASILQASSKFQKQDLQGDDKILQPDTKWTTDEEVSQSLRLAEVENSPAQLGLRQIEEEKQYAPDPLQSTIVTTTKGNKALCETDMNNTEKKCQSKLPSETVAKYLIRRKGGKFLCLDVSNFNTSGVQSNRIKCEHYIEVFENMTLITAHSPITEGVMIEAVDDITCGRWAMIDHAEGGYKCIHIDKRLGRTKLDFLLQLCEVYSGNPPPPGQPLTKEALLQVPGNDLHSRVQPGHGANAGGSYRSGSTNYTRKIRRKFRWARLPPT